MQMYFGESVPAFTMCTPTENRGMVLTKDKGKEYRFEQAGLNVWRSSFDNWFATKASECDADVKDETAVLSCLESNGLVSVTLRGEKIYTETAKYILDCEGVVGALKRKLPNKVPEYITTFQTYNQGSIELDYHYFYAYLQPELSEDDAWFNVKDSHLVLGVSVKDVSKIDR